MTPERWQHVMQVLDVALTLDTAQRVPFLDQTCSGDAELRREVESLIRSHHQAGTGFLNAPAVSLKDTADTSSVPHRVGHRVGAYDLREEIGRGGMGEVYRAVRADGQFTKEVALKLVRAGADTASVLSRFRNERQILASLDHPNIAQLARRRHHRRWRALPGHGTGRGHTSRQLLRLPSTLDHRAADTVSPGLFGGAIRPPEACHSS